MLNGIYVNLRAIEPRDIDLMYKWENETDIWHVSGTTTPFSKYTMEQYIESCKNDIYTNKQLRLAIDIADVSGKTIGYIDLYDFEPHNHRAGVGILIGDKTERRKNYAKESLQLIIKYAFNILHLHQLYCHITESNRSSIGLFTKLGFKQTGILQEWLLSNGEWDNVLVLQLFNENDAEEE